MRPENLPSISVNFPCSWEIFRQIRQLSVQQGEFPSNSVTFPFSCETFCSFLSTLRAIKRPSVNFCQLFMQLGDLPSTSVNFSCGRETFCQLPSTFRADERPFVNFSCCQETSRCHLLNFHAAKRPSVTSVNIPCCQKNFRSLLSTFSAARKDLPPNSVNFWSPG